MWGLFHLFKNWPKKLAEKRSQISQSRVSHAHFSADFFAQLEVLRNATQKSLEKISQNFYFPLNKYFDRTLVWKFCSMARQLTMANVLAFPFNNQLSMRALFTQVVVYGSEVPYESSTIEIRQELGKKCLIFAPCHARALNGPFLLSEHCSRRWKSPQW